VKNKCIEFKNSINDQSQELYFYGDIVSDESMKYDYTDTCPQDILDILGEIDDTKPLNIYINSGGGSVFAGISIYNILKRSKCNKTVYIDALAGSIASVIAMVGDEIIMPSNSFLMIHKPLCCIQGNATDMIQMASDLDKIQLGIMNIYAEKLATGCTIETIQALVDAETWIVGSEASKYFNVTVVEANKAVASISSLINYNKVPKELLKKVEDVVIKNDVVTPESCGCLCSSCTNCSCINCSCECVQVEPNNKLDELKLLKAKLELESL